MHDLKYMVSICVALLVLGCDSEENLPVEIAGQWTGDISSPTADFCNLNILVNISQDGENVSGSFSLVEDASGAFQGTIDGDMFSGVLTSVFEGCIGTGNFSGSVSDDRIEISAPEITTAIPGCTFCQNNSIVLTR